MPAALRRQPGWRSTPLGHRAASIALTIVAHVLVFLLLWTITPSRTPPPDEEPPLNTFDVRPSATTAPRPAPSAAAAPTRRAAPASTSPAPSTAATTPPPPVPLPAPTSAPSLNALDFDLASVPRGGRENAEPTGDSPGPVYGPGDGPGGQRLYNAEWRREPTDAQLRTYLPADVPRPAWAMIACRTAENYGVENCRFMDEHPRGSGLARAMRQAAWQFQVHPPRLGGKKLIGAWVRIRIDFTTVQTEAAP